MEGSEYEGQNSGGAIAETFYSTLWQRLFRFAYSLVRNHAEAEDLTQEVFVVLFREQQAGRSVEQVNAWMQTVVRHLVYRRFRKQRPGIHVPLDATDGDDLALKDTLRDQAPSPETLAISDRMLRLGARIIYEFPEQDRECILMYFRGYDFQQIASARGISRWTARRLTLKALEKFQSRVNSNE